MVLQAPAAGQTSASIAVISNAVNATSGVNIAVSGNVIQDLRPAAAAAIAVTPVTTTGCAGATYPGCNTIQVTVTAGQGFGTPTGTVTLSVGSATGNQPKQTQTLNSAGVATFTYTGLLGGTYTVNADYSGAGTAGATQNTCATATPCFSGAAAKGTFTIARAIPTITLGVPVTNNQCLNYTTLTSGAASRTCAANPELVTVWAGNTYVYWTKPVYVSAIVSSSVGTPSGTVTFTQNGQPADPTQGVGGAIAPNGNGVATFLLQNLSLGVYNLSAAYSGDVNYAPVNLSVANFLRNQSERSNHCVGRDDDHHARDARSSDSDADAAGGLQREREFGMQFIRCANQAGRQPTLQPRCLSTPSALSITPIPVRAPRLWERAARFHQPS